MTIERSQHMVTFAHVIRAGSFVGAAEILGVAPSVISKHISKLEKSLGAKLLNRTTRSLSLTEVGNEIYQHSEQIAEALQQSEQAVARLQSEPQGELRITTVNSISNALLAPIIPAFLDRYPNIELEIVGVDHPVNLIEQAFDLALRITSQPPDNLVAKRLAPVRFMVCASPDYLARYGRPMTIQELQSHICLSYPGESAQQWRFLHQGQRLEAPIHSRLRINSMEALRRLAIAGTGIALLPSYAIAEELRSGSLQPLLADYRGFGDATLYAIHAPNRYGSIKIRALIEFLERHLDQMALSETS